METMTTFLSPRSSLRWALLILLAMACSSQAQFEVINRGMRGYSVGKVAQAWPKVLKDVPAPDVVVLLVGTNDMINSEYLTPLDTFRERYDALVDALRKTSKHVVVATLPPAVEEHLFRRHKKELYKGESPNERIQQANKIIKEIAEQKGCTLVDLDSVFAPGTWEEGNPQGLLTTAAASGRPDGVHPNTAGARKIGEAVAERIKSLGLTGGTIICLGDSITYGGGLPGEGTTEGETYPAVLKQTLSGS
jgi:lysophospholipase L1-like esterase